jgi:hypothetical protein
MLPMPVLDGGHIVMSVLERIRRRPLDVRLVEYTTTVFAVLIHFLFPLRDLFRYKTASPDPGPVQPGIANRAARQTRPRPGQLRPVSLCATASRPSSYTRRQTREVVVGRSRQRRRHHRRRSSRGQTVHAHLRHHGHRRVRQTNPRTGRRRLPDRPHHRPHRQGRRQPQEHRRRTARPRLPRAHGRRHPFQARRRPGSRPMGGDGARQSRQLRRQEEIRRPRIQRRPIRRRTGADRGAIHPAGQALPATRTRPAHRRPITAP